MSPVNSYPVIARGKRGVLTGRTGSGKTTLAKWLLYRSPGPWVLLNPKHTAGLDKLPGSVVIHSVSVAAVREAYEAPGIRFVIVNPEAEENHPEILDGFIADLFSNYEGLGLYVDELTMVHINGRPGDGLIRWLTLGREAELSFLGSTQRPKRISLFIFSEADYFGVMTLNLADDRKRVYEFIGHDEILHKMRPHFWTWYDVTVDRLRQFGPVPV